MTDQFEQNESRALREAIEKLSERVDTLEKTLFEKPTEVADTSETTAPPFASASAKSSEKTLPELEPEVAEPKISIPPPPSQLESMRPWAKTSRPEFGNFWRSGGDESWETVVGERWLTWLGSASLILAVAYFVPWAWRHYQLPAWLRVLVFHLAGVGILGVAKLFSRKQLPLLAQGVTGLGIFTLYTAAYAMHHHYHLGGDLSSTATFLDCALITALAIVIALRSNSAVVILLGALGGYLTPWIASSGGGEYVVTFVYLAFLNVALLVCALLRPWQFLKPLAVVATAVMFLDWMFHPLSDVSTLWGTEWLLVLHAVIFFVGTTFPSLRWRQSSVDADLLALAGNSLWFVGATWLLFHQRSDQQLAAVCWGMSALHAVFFAWTYRRVTNADRMPRLHLALAIVFFTLAVPLQLRDSLDYLAYAWAAEGLVFTAIAVYFGDRQLARAGQIVLGLAIARALLFDFSSAPELVGNSPIDRRFLVILCSGLATMAAGSSHWWVPRLVSPRDGVVSLDQQDGGLLLALGNVVAMIGLTCQWDSRLVLVLWSLDAAFVWGIGFATGNRSARKYALLLSLILVGGRVLYHGAHVDTPFLCLLNERFGSLVLVALLYFVPAWYVRTRLSRNGPMLSEFEQGIPALLHVLANVVLLGAFSLEIHDWHRPVNNWLGHASTAEQVTYSVVWTIYAGVLVAIGFWLKYRLPRVMGLLGFLLVAFKVFFVDLANLPLILRVLALAAFGGTLLVTSFWYQKFSARLKSET
ncbi:MAG: DUF2339 domain-containing protein [Planctomycetes bacterium]|nr:DUF2339 domain-containing protein [Planctomycetota bacterium]